MDIKMELSDKRLLKEDAYINGLLRAADSGATFEVRNPATGEVIANVADMGGAETRRAIEVANAAWAGWRSQLVDERSAILRRWHDLILENLDDLAILLTSEMGKPLAEAEAEVRYGASFVEWFAEEGKRIYGDILPTHKSHLRLMILKQPIGVVAAITPWNFPSAMITRKVAPALAAGCTVVVKPAEDTPLSALALAELAERAGFPAGVFNIVTGQDPVPIGHEMTSNPMVRKLSFTGSTEIGKLLMRQSADTLKKVSFELGGNAPFIVFDDADIDAAVKGAIACKYRNAGQTCVCANRFYVQEAVYDEFTSKYALAVGQLRVGSGLKGAEIGPLINQQAVSKVERLVADAVSQGASVAIGGKRHELGQTFFEPTVLTDVTMEMACSREEIFGPVSPLFRFQDEDEVIQMANKTRYGLAAYFYTRDYSRVWRVAEALEYGIVGINESLLSTKFGAFGGVKESGIGREGGKYGIDEFLEIKYLCLGGLS
jgi:succinate-semialdehyde dehydrogenase/glutarate-semialdehyde dehydrogenase